MTPFQQVRYQHREPAPEFAPIAALGAALARPWADFVLTGAATVGQIQSNVAALEVAYDASLEEQLRSASVGSPEYWRGRSSFRWN